MAAAEYYNNTAASGSYPPHPSSSYPHHPSQTTYLSPRPQQGALAPYHARPGSAHSDVGGYTPPYPSSRPGSSHSHSHTHYNHPSRPHSADPYRYYSDGEVEGEDEKGRERGRGGEGRKRGGEEGDGERGLGATLVGGGAGGFLAHKLGRGTLGTVLGSAVGALAMNALEDRMGGHGKHGKHGGRHGQHGRHHHSHSHGGHHHGSHGSSSGNGGLLGRVENLMGGSRSSSSHGSHHGGGGYYDGHHGHGYGHGHGHGHH